MSVSNPPTTRRLIGSSLIIGSLLTLLVATLPEEQTLGHILKAVFLHAALVQTGLIFFAVAGALGLAYLLRPNAGLAHWNVAAQGAALWIWVAYALSSMAATYMAWGIAIAWYEPRTRASAAVLGAALLFALLARWLADARFLALVNLLAAGLSWFLVKGASLLRHPFDPIGTSDSALFQAFFAGIFLLTLIAAGQLLWFLYLRARHRPVRQANLPRQQHAA